MRPLSGLRALPLLLVLLAALASAPGTGAQQPSSELRELQDSAAALYRAGDVAGARRLAERALPLLIRQYGADHEQTGIHYYSLGLLSEAGGELAAAASYFAQSLRVREKVYGPEAAGTALALQSLGNVYVKMGQPNAAQPLFRRAAKIRRERPGGAHAFAASAYSDLASVSLARGDWSAALASYRQAVRLITSQDTSQIIVKSLVEEEIRRFSETFVGLSRAAWQLSA